jgi:hypothetical protein
MLHGSSAATGSVGVGVGVGDPGKRPFEISRRADAINP